MCAHTGKRFAYLTASTNARSACAISALAPMERTSDISHTLAEVLRTAEKPPTIGMSELHYNTCMSQPKVGLSMNAPHACAEGDQFLSRKSVSILRNAKQILETLSNGQDAQPSSLTVDMNSITLLSL
jgi:hypothetical protein